MRSTRGSGRNDGPLVTSSGVQSVFALRNKRLHDTYKRFFNGVTIFLYGIGEDAVAQSQEWVDGFLMVGNQPALDFLNTELVNEGQTVELLPDVPALARWFAAAGLVEAADARRALRDTAASERFRRKLLAFRSLLRQAVLAHEAGERPGPEFFAELNRLLEKHPTRFRAAWGEGQVKLDPISETAQPDDLWAVIAAATAALFTEVSVARLRKCETCIVQFHDLSKKGTRHWCSMNLCGNKVKVAAYQRRKREAKL